MRIKYLIAIVVVIAILVTGCVEFKEMPPCTGAEKDCIKSCPDCHICCTKFDPATVASNDTNECSIKTVKQCQDAGWLITDLSYKNCAEKYCAWCGNERCDLDEDYSICPQDCTYYNYVHRTCESVVPESEKDACYKRETLAAPYVADICENVLNYVWGCTFIKDSYTRDSCYVEFAQKYGCYQLCSPELISDVELLDGCFGAGLRVFIATLKDRYSIDEQIKLTDPPDKNTEDNVNGTFYEKPGKLNLGNWSELTVTPNFQKESIIAPEMYYGEETGQEAVAILGETLPEVQPPKGYIVELKREPLLKKEVSLKKLAEKNEQKIEAMSDYNPIKYVYKIFATSSEDVPKKLAKQKKQIMSDRQKIKDKIRKKLKKAKVETLVTGSAVADLSEQGNTLVVFGEYEKVFNGLALDITREEAKEIKKLREVKDVYPNLEVKATLMGSVPHINADYSWSLGYTGKDITIAVIDTGVDYHHPDLGGCMGAGCKVVDGYDFVNGDSDPMDDNGHGTHCAAIAAGQGTLKGVAPQAKIYAYKTLNAYGTGNMNAIIAAIERAVDPNQDGDFSDHVDIISMSLGSYCKGFPSDECGPDDPESTAVDNAVDAGVVVVVAAGNSGPDIETICSPGTARKAITVGATYKSNFETLSYSSCIDTDTQIDQIPCFSSTGPVWDIDGLSLIKPDVVAPGVEICAAQWDTAFGIDDNYFDPARPDVHRCVDSKHMAISGTSMAAPHVAGVAALVKDVHPDWSPNDIKNALMRSANYIGDLSIKQGHGLIDVESVFEIEDPSLFAFIDIPVSRISETVQIKGTLSSKNFQKYNIEIGEGRNPSDWVLIKDSNVFPSNNILIDSFDTTQFSDGYHTIKLTLTTTTGKVIEDKAMIEIDNIKITSPREGSIFGPYKNVEIEGYIRRDYNSYVIEFSRSGLESWSSDGISLTGLSEGLFATWNTQNLESGEYDIRLKVFHQDDKISTEQITVTIDSTLKPGWPKKIESKITATYVKATIADIDEDYQGKEIILDYLVQIGDKIGRRLSLMHADGTIREGWPKSLTISNYKIPSAISDINNDGKNEILTLGRSWGIYGFDVAGNSLPGLSYKSDKYKPPEGGCSLNILSIGDIDPDYPGQEIVMGYFYKPLVTVVHSDGTVMQGWPYLFEGPEDIEHAIIYGIAIGDINYDGLNEIIATYSNNNGKKGILVLNNKAQLLWSNETSISSWGPFFGVSQPVIGDLDNDGDLEIIFAPKSDEVIAYHHDGSLMEGWPPANIINYNEVTNILIANVDDDPYKEVVLTLSPMWIPSYWRKNSPPLVYVLNHDGTVVDGWPYKTDVFNPVRDSAGIWWQYSTSTLAAADVDNDGKSEILFGTLGDHGYCGLFCGGNSIFLLDDNGMVMEGFPKYTMPYYRGMGWPGVKSVNFADIDYNNKLDIIATASDGYVYAWELGKSETLDWPIFQHDNQHSGFYAHRPQSKIENLGTNRFSGKINIKIQKQQGAQWTNYLNVISNRDITVPENSLVKLDQIFNQENVRINEPGRYRVCVELMYSTGELIEYDLGQRCWEFKVVS
ncbi:hypothetical protein DRJ17_02855 [Candidatus Woesearchaeota archaeon]|nr:MAG: hypothetical protein DRJ17_02855 [Candidatus Woesearchaeota archaeon]